MQMQALKYISEIHKSECPFTIASYSVRLLILGSLQTQRAVTSGFLPFLSTAWEELSVKKQLENVLETRNYLFLLVLFSVKKFLTQSSGFNEQQGINSLLRLGHSQGGEGTRGLTSVPSKIGKLSVFVKVTCQAVQLVLPAVVRYQMIFPTFSLFFYSFLISFFYFFPHPSFPQHMHMDTCCCSWQ